MVAAPEALERPLRLVRLEPRAFVGDGDPREAVVALDVDRDPAFGRAVAPAVLDEILDRPLEGRSIPTHDDRL